MENKKKIIVNGKELVTKYYIDISEELHQKILNYFYSKPSEKEVRKQIMDVILKGSNNYSKIERYFFRDLMYKVKLYHSKWSIEEVLQNKELLGYFVDKVLKNSKTFSEDFFENLETIFRIGGKGIATKVTNMPLAEAKKIITKYNINNNYYDFSCGWGVRLTASLSLGTNYFGTDPNYLLTERLVKLGNMILDMYFNLFFSPIFDIRTQGAEEFVKEWENKMGLCFSSPPYFGLEDYKIGNQSYKEGMSYQDWLNNFLYPTIENCFRYNIKGGFLAINIKNYDKYDLEEQAIKIAKKVGYKFLTTETLVNLTRIKSTGELGNSNENIYIFKKE